MQLQNTMDEMEELSKLYPDVDDRELKIANENLDQYLLLSDGKIWKDSKIESRSRVKECANDGPLIIYRAETNDNNQTTVEYCRSGGSIDSIRSPGAGCGISPSIIFLCTL